MGQEISADVCTPIWQCWIDKKNQWRKEEKKKGQKTGLMCFCQKPWCGDATSVIYLGRIMSDPVLCFGPSSSLNAIFLMTFCSMLTWKVSCGVPWMEGTSVLCFVPVQVEWSSLSGRHKCVCCVSYLKVVWSSLQEHCVLHIAHCWVLKSSKKTRNAS